MTQKKPSPVQAENVQKSRHSGQNFAEFVDNLYEENSEELHCTIGSETTPCDET